MKRNGKEFYKNINGHRAILVIVLCFFVVCWMSGAKNPVKRGRAKKTTVDTKVYLEHADELSYDIYGKHPDAQFVKGKVSFLHKGARLTCDSALYYQATNSFEAFSNVKMRQGDTLTLTADYAYYDGNDEMCEVRRNVILTHRKSKLYCDSLNYDRMYSIGYFFEGGKLIDGDTRLTSDWGQYSSATKEAVFYYNVNLTNDKSVTRGDTLYYDTQTSMAHVKGPSTITMKDDIVLTEDGYYNSKTDKTELFSRSTVKRKDGKTITADSLYHDSKTGISEGYSGVVFRDTANKTMFLGDYVYYDENSGYGYATKKAVAIDYSQGDSLYAHGDTMKMVTHNINTDSVFRMVYAYPHVRIFRNDVQAVCDSMVMNSKDSTLVMYKDPIMWSEGRQVLGEEIRMYMADSTIRFAHVIGQAFSIEKMDEDSLHFNQISSKEMMSWFTEGKLRKNQAQGNVKTVFYVTDDADTTLIALNYLETDTMKMYMSPERKMEKISTVKHEGTMYPISQIPHDKYRLPNFAWFEYVRPKDKDDIFVWVPKAGGTELKKERRREAPLQNLAKKVTQKAEKKLNELTDGGITLEKDSLIGNGEVKSDSLTNGEVKNDSLTNGEMKNDSLTNGEMPAGDPVNGEMMSGEGEKETPAPVDNDHPQAMKADASDEKKDAAADKR